MQNLVYREHRPVPPLREHVQLLWELRGRCDEAAPYRVVPDGCMGLVLNFGVGVEQIIDATTTLRRPPTLFIGEVRRPYAMQSRGKVDLLGVHFRPGAARSFLDAPAPEVVDRIADESVLCSPLARAIAGTVRNADACRRVELLQVALAALVGSPSRGELLVRGAVRALVQRQGHVAIEPLAQAFGVTRRQLERRFIEELGIAPKSLAAVLRFRRALNMIDALTDDSTGVALECGYYDQSHLIRDFKRFTGTAPGPYRRLTEAADEAR